MHRFNTNEDDVHLHGRVNYKEPPMLIRHISHSYHLERVFMNAYVFNQVLINERKTR